MSDALLGAIAVVSAIALASIIVAAGLAGQPPRRRRPRSTRCPRSIGVGTVQMVAGSDDPVIVIEVESVAGQRFTGRLCHGADDEVLSALRPGVIVLVSFDPASRKQLTLADDAIAVRATADHTLLRYGVLTHEQLDLIRRGTRSCGVVTGMRTTGREREELREVELDLIVTRPEGGQFPAQEITLVPEAALAKVSPGSIIDAYYLPENESAIAVCVPPA
ncbi:hypothetical protein CRM90_06770 [Mycobacterium sp. ENV421]|uniref:hypothetical protein n=1 Tax=Mycobacterium sp. ENV421 TaxID=1213407 RepID=UPI000C9A6D09|nr:hypothetical protein [Mycobacterium sp. ENV421]PND58345.1 hypothetical protein CRM90_06770 [Mycobacterium sp. ENV421]